MTPHTIVALHCGEAFLLAPEHYGPLLAQWRDETTGIVDYETLGGGQCAFNTSHIAHLELVTEGSDAVLRDIMGGAPKEPWEG